MRTWLHDELLLLAYDDEGSAEIGNPTLDYSLAGALLMELALARRIDVVDKRVVVTSPEPVGDALADEALAAIAADEKPRKPQHWVNKLSARLRDRLLDRQVEAGVLRREKGRVLWVFPRVTYPSVGGMPVTEREARQRLRSAVARSSSGVDDRTAALCGLVLAAGLERVVVETAEGRDRRAEREVRDRLKEITAGDWTVKAVRNAIDEMQAAIAVAASAATTVTIVTSSGT